MKINNLNQQPRVETRNGSGHRRLVTTLLTMPVALMACNLAIQAIGQNEQPSVDLQATAQGVESTPVQPVNNEAQANVPAYQILGVPGSIDKSAMPKWSETSDFPQGNSIGLNTQGWLREPGVRTVDSAAEEDQSAWSTTHADVQKTFEQEGPSAWWAPEGGFAMFTGAHMSVSFNNANGETIMLNLDAAENHSWMVIVSNHDEDYATPNDGNLPIALDNYDPAFTMGTALPLGQYISEDYINQNVATAHQENCGHDGCFNETVVMIDRSGAFTIINQAGLNAPWTQVATNIK